MLPETLPVTACPPTAELERLVRGRLSEAQTVALTDHVEVCQMCQQRLDALAGGATAEFASNLRESARITPPKDSAFWKALGNAQSEVRATALFVRQSGEIAEAENRNLDLDFLQPSDEPGRMGRLGTFGIIRVVGRGGMGVVLHAFDPHLTRDVAIKVIDPQLANNEVARQRFCREARAAAAVTHDNLVAVHQVDEDEASGLPYLVMQLINGESLEQRLKRIGKMTPLEVARLGMQAAAGLAAAHAGGLIHRDIKPANILMETPADRVKLTDFGLARAAEDVKLTRTGFVAGSPLYMAPEQARGDEVDARSDLFSLGSVLYEAAAGTHPFDAKTPLTVLRRVTDETPPPLSDVNPDVPEWLSEIVDRLLAKNAADRYQSAGEVAEVFAAELAHAHALSPLDVPAEVCSASASRSGVSARKRKHICWKSVAFRATPWIGGVALGSLLTVLLWSPATPAPIIAPEPAVTSKPVMGSDPTPRMVLPGDSGTIWGLAFWDNDRLISGMENGAVTIWDLHKGIAIKTLEPMLGGNVWSADVSADGQYLVAPSDDSRVTVWHLQGDQRYTVAYKLPQPTSTKSAVFSPDGTKLATGDRNATIRVWDLEAQIPIELVGHWGTVHALAFSPDGKRLASAGADGKAKVWNLEIPDLPPVTLGAHKGPVYGVAYCPHGKLLATTGWDGVVRVWNTDGSLAQTIDAHEGDAWSVSFGNNGKWIASAGQNSVKVWNVETGAEVFSYRGTRAFHIVRFAPNGTTLAAAGRDGSVRVWDIGK